jgi:hypothetical protein
MKLFEILEIMGEEKEPEEISVLLSGEVLRCCGLNLVQESFWIDSGYKDWKYRVDPEDPKLTQQRHIHIAKNKHTSSKNMQASWNSDGTRHDRKSFNPKVGNVDRVREIARSVLKIGPEITLESYDKSKSKQIFTEDISSSADGRIAYVYFHIVE